ncbi:MAG: bifunctional phosphoglucose/phosphomannose isomerase, partial [Candidatus Eisenbacteria bacterium]|nr:bifunctional phosphoglucose/phosphomannose isomerase [Candidatus Eisenbacteria bacterium]
MSALEPPYGARDSGEMAARIAGLSAQIEEALQRLARDPWHPPLAGPALLAVGGLGGSAIAGDLTAGLYGDRMPRPLVVVRDYRWPAWVGKDALALLSSYSGGTEETLALYREAGGRGIPRLAMTSGGMLGRLCTRDGVGVHLLPGGAPPRAALFSSWVALTALIHALGWADDPAPLWREAAALLRSLDGELAPGAPEERNPAKRLARSLHGKLVLVYSGTERIAPVALRVRQQLNENAKLPGHSAA